MPNFTVMLNTAKLTNFAIIEGLQYPPSTNQGQIWHARVHAWSALTHKPSPKLVHSVTLEERKKIQI